MQSKQHIAYRNKINRMSNRNEITHHIMTCSFSLNILVAISVLIYLHILNTFYYIFIFLFR